METISRIIAANIGVAFLWTCISSGGRLVVGFGRFLTRRTQGTRGANGGSIVIKALGLSDEEIEAKFGFLVEAYKYGAPPHGGLGIGLDRLAMVMLGCDSLRDITAFPKLQNASELMSECPATVDQESLDVLGIKIVEKNEED